MLSSSPLADAAGWLSGNALPSIVEAVAIIAILIVGLAMLQGRMSVRRGGLAVVGCFVIMGSGSIANALVGLRASSPPTPVSSIAIEPRAPPQIKARPDNPDPYAGASLTK